ncbi:molybdopterin oxidoreductase family protein [Saccharibacillus sp. CPCC 101409]|uniref:molybdopterin-containing oxidoreductase family protein n=1 Tax=Saccharibacillus sp. CPCC 101409 TaxID=3058041 RepID=UPI0026722864|nr:molybdopterin oxidoreductase family protein [Saccharibacillus sp. CPCC 101409]MDO3410163.1 molybdopterin oxidoreductase family protein [Saccharibacillus sp. CPCC 101409]
MIDRASGVFPAVCPLDCPDTCGLLLHKENGKIVKVTGNPDHPETKGAICNKVRHMAERVHHPERLTHPMKRTGAKGSGRFVRITWDEALTEIAERFRNLSAEHGPDSILPYSFYGNMGVLNAEGMDRRFFGRLGASKLAYTICNSAGNAGWKYTMGFGGGSSPEDTLNAKLFIVWGGNIVSTSMHQAVLMEQARKRGAKIVVIDVHRNMTGRRADWFIPLHPGTDTALALGLMHVLFERGLTDEDFLRRYTVGSEEMREHAKTYTPEKVSRITGVPAEDVVRLAELYGETSPSHIHIGNGLQHHDNGGMAVRTIACLPALTGQWARGGGAMKSNGAYASLNDDALQRPDLRANPGVRTINMNALADALLTLEKKVRALFVFGSNPAVVAPDSARVREGLMREDLFTVVHELFLTDTAKYADILLPATSSFENTDLYTSYWHHYVHLQEPVIAPAGESKSNFELFSLLARAMGFEEEAFAEDEKTVIRAALDNPGNPYLGGVTLDRLEEERFVGLDMSPKNDYLERLTTPSGKIELYSEQLAAIGLPPLPTYVPLEEGFDGENRAERSGTYPLMFISPPNHNFLNSTFANVEKHRALEKEPTLQIHPFDARERGIEDGQTVEAFNARGVYPLKAVVTDLMLPGTVVSQGLWWPDGAGKLAGGKARRPRLAANALTSPRIADMGGGATFFSTAVEVRRLESGA